MRCELKQNMLSLNKFGHKKMSLSLSSFDIFLFSFVTQTYDTCENLCILWRYDVIEHSVVALIYNPDKLDGCVKHE